jgi:hypothetical protein
MRVVALLVERDAIGFPIPIRHLGRGEIMRAFSSHVAPWRSGSAPFSRHCFWPFLALCQRQPLTHVALFLPT